VFSLPFGRSGSLFRPNFGIFESVTVLVNCGVVSEQGIRLVKIVCLSKGKHGILDSCALTATASFVPAVSGHAPHMNEVIGSMVSFLLSVCLPERSRRVDVLFRNGVELVSFRSDCYFMEVPALQIPFPLYLPIFTCPEAKPRAAAFGPVASLYSCVFVAFN
jgi:hypothetical protein